MNLPPIGALVLMRTHGKPARARVIEYVGRTVRLKFDDVAFHDQHAPFRTLYLSAFEKAMEALAK
ncbi:MAG: hypothetical protein JNK15_23680 [Planctomycetes bacterium]|nr:hypothetical protein [Planctomycetota bacterium]